MATNKPPKRAQKGLQKCVPILLRGHRKKGTEKRPKSLALQGFVAPTPCVRQPVFETSETGKPPKVLLRVLSRVLSEIGVLPRVLNPWRALSGALRRALSGALLEVSLFWALEQVDRLLILGKGKSQTKINIFVR